ncbi:MAG: glycosyltransferase [Desulfosoma sp.]
MEKGIATLIAQGRRLFKHRIVCLQDSGESELLLPQGIPVLSLHKPPGNSLGFILNLARCLKSLQPDVVHTRNWGGLDGVVAARLAGIRTVVHGEHGWSYEDPYGVKTRRVFLRRLFSRWVREYTCVSRQIKEWLQNKVKVHRPINQIYNGVDTQKYKPSENVKDQRRRLNLPIDQYIIGTVGRLDPIKNHATLLNAFLKIRYEIPGSILLVVGEGSERIRLEKAAPDGVVFLGNRLDVPELLRCLDVFVLPSLNEGISNTILEAMATGLAVVATNVGGNPELVQDGVNGTLFLPRDVDGLARILVRYWREPQLRRAHGEAGRRRAVESFGVYKMVHSYEEVYLRVVGLNTG